MKKEYLNWLIAYANLFNRELKVAVYWNKWNIWTLISIEDFICEKDQIHISFNEAFEYNQMVILGDCLICTTPPLKAKIMVDATKPITIDADGIFSCMSNGVEYYCGNKKIDDKHEAVIASYLMEFGNWIQHSTIPEGDATQLRFIEFTYDPEEKTSEQKFEIIGMLSGMMSNWFKSLTSLERKLGYLRTCFDPSLLHVDIPPNYQGTYLPLWRIVWTPYHRDNG